MTKLHITQDKHGFWMLSAEPDNAPMTVVSCHFTKPGHLIHDAQELIAKGTFPGATILIDAPSPDLVLPANADDWPEEYKWPEPKKARL
jgi:hypothetical protein